MEECRIQWSHALVELFVQSPVREWCRAQILSQLLQCLLQWNIYAQGYAHVKVLQLLFQLVA